MRISTEQRSGYSLLLYQDDNLYQVRIFDSAGNLVASSMSGHTEAESALTEAQRIVDAHRNARRRR